MTNDIAPSNEELAEIEAESAEMRKASWEDWLRTNPTIDMNDEF